MPSTFSPSLRIELIGEGEQSGVWGTTTNNNLGDLIEQAITGTTNLDVTAGNITLTSLNGLVDEARSATLYVYGTPGVTRILTIPNVYKNYTVQNVTANIVQVKTASGTAFDCPPLSHSYINCDESNVVVGRSITTAGNALTSSSAPFNSPAFTGVPTAPTAAAGTSTTQLATTAFVTTALSAALPVGVITMWSGSVASIPSGWALCNGASGTPDLRDRFVVGAGTSYAPGNTGGFNTITLNTDQIPSHQHNASGGTSIQDASHSHSITIVAANTDHVHGVNGDTGLQSNDHGHSGSTDAQGNHNHGLIVDADSGAGAGPYFKADGQAITTNFTNDAGIHNHNVSTGGVNANHSHAISFNSGAMSANATHIHSASAGIQSANHAHSFNVNTSFAGGGAAHENRPPYYALAYIMKV
jgi:microcystin-dependent protein